MKVNDIFVNGSYERGGWKETSTIVASPNESVLVSTLPKDVIDTKRSVETVHYKVNYAFNPHTKQVLVDVVDKGTGLIKDVKPENLSQSFQKIDNIRVFDAFLDSTHTKVSCLSDGEYKIYADIKGLGGARGVRELRDKQNEVFWETVERAKESGEMDDMNEREIKSWASQVLDKIKDLGWEILKYTVTAVVTWIGGFFTGCNLI